MSIQVTLTTGAGQVMTGLSYSHSSVPTDNCGMLPCPVFANSLNGGASYGNFSFRGKYGWVYVPATNILGTPLLQTGAPT